MATQLPFTPVDDINKIHSTLRANFDKGDLKNIAFRKHQLLQLGYMLKEHYQRFEDALAQDLGRPKLEAQFLELNQVIGEVASSVKSVDKWAAPEKPPFSFNYYFMRPVIRKEAKGVVLIIAPFNYPIFLTFGPLIGAIAAGNAAVVKPSELSPATSALMAELFPKYLDPNLYAVVNGAVPETTRLLELKWDHILYTGSGRVAKIVAKAAAEHLTPVSLELGGKSPVFIDPGCDLQTAAKRLVWGKMSNAGQTCVAPDYVLVPREFQNQLVDELVKTSKEFYPDPATSNSFARLITPQHYARVKRMLDDTKGTVVIGGETKEEAKYIAPTIVKDVGKTDSLMSDEIFGPVLPILPVENVDEAIAFVNSNDHPLALYVFSKDSQYKQKVFDNTQSGAAVANEMIIHIGADGLPFGGIGPSGSGYHTGKYSFDMFTHLRSSLDSPSWLDMILGARYPPYTDAKLKAVSKIGAAKLPPKDKFKSAAQSGLRGKL